MPFCHSEAHYLGRNVSREGIRPGQAKVKGVKHFPVPKNVPDVWTFFDLSGYYQKFGGYFSLITAPYVPFVYRDASQASIL